MAPDGTVLKYYFWGYNDDSRTVVINIYIFFLKFLYLAN